MYFLLLLLVVLILLLLLTIASIIVIIIITISISISIIIIIVNIHIYIYNIYNSISISISISIIDIYTYIHMSIDHNMRPAKTVRSAPRRRTRAYIYIYIYIYIICIYIYIYTYIHTYIRIIYIYIYIYIHTCLGEQKPRQGRERGAMGSKNPPCIRITRIHLTIFSPRVGLPRQIYVIGTWAGALRLSKIFQGLGPKKNGNLIMRFGCIRTLAFVCSACLMPPDIRADSIATGHQDSSQGGAEESGCSGLHNIIGYFSI